MLMRDAQAPHLAALCDGAPTAAFRRQGPHVQLASLVARQEVLAPWQQDLCITIGAADMQLITQAYTQCMHCPSEVTESST